MQQPFDFPLEQLRLYKPNLTCEPDFDSFWADTLAELASVPLSCQRKDYDYPVKGVKVQRVTFSGFLGARIEAWLVIPVGTRPFPGLCMYHGYNWAFDGCLHDVVNWALKGYAVLHMLVRGQQGNSEDNVVVPSGFYSGWMSKGILSKEGYYYRAVYMDAVRALEVLAAQPEVDAGRIGVVGGSQGGALALVAAALSDIPKVAVADYPFLCHFDRAIDMTQRGPFLELNEYFKRNTSPEVEEAARRTLSYFDVMNLAPRIRCRTSVCIGLLDDIAPPSTVFAAYNHLVCEKDIAVYRYFGHEDIPARVEPKLWLLMKELQDV